MFGTFWKLFGIVLEIVRNCLETVENSLFVFGKCWKMFGFVLDNFVKNWILFSKC